MALYTAVLFKVLYCKIKMFSFFVFVFYVLFEKYYQPITVQYYITDCVSLVPRLTVRLNEQTDIQICSQDGT